MHADTFSHRDAMASGDAAHAASDSLSLREFLQLGLFRVGYLTWGADEQGRHIIVIRGADGETVAELKTSEMAMLVADYLGLTLLPVH